MTDETTETTAEAGAASPSPQDFQVSHPGNINPEVLQNISVTLAIEVGRAQIKIKDLMRLTQRRSTTRWWRRVKSCWSMTATACV